MRIISWVALLFLFVGCGPNSLEDYRCSGESIVKDLCKDLSAVSSLEDLKEQSPQLKKKMRKLTKLMIEADFYHQEHKTEEVSYERSWMSDKLCYELFRICEEIEGGREVIELLQGEMLDELDVQMHRKGLKY